MASIRARALLLALTLVASPALAEVVAGRVVGVSDGDTITVLDGAKTRHKVRLSGIDAPEKGQAFGDRSRENLSRLVFDKQVEAHCHKRDRYGREVCKVIRAGTDANLEQIKAGLAWWYWEYAKEQTPQEREDYAREEVRAKASHVGLWKDPRPVPPWEWRRNNKGGK